MGLPEAFLSEPTESFGWQMIVALTAQLDGKVQVATDAGTSVAITCRERR